MKREWKPVEGYEGLYEVSNFGEVKSLNYKRTGKEKLLKPQKDGKGYLYVTLYKNGIKKPSKINRLVWQTFVNEIPPKWDVNHLDENKENNHLENLKACSHGDNMNWGTRNRRAAVKIAAALINHPQKSKVVEAVDKVSGRVVYVFPSTQEAGRQGFNQGAVAACCRNCSNRPGNNIYKGFIWRYKE